jgi:lysozyme
MSKNSDNEALARAVQRWLGITEDGWGGVATMAAFLERTGQGFSGKITERIALELISHEAIVREAYKDSEGVWTWGVGVTSASGHSVERYKDNPQTIQRCLEVCLWLCRTKYGPEVMAAFKGRALTEAQFAAALSFHYNTGAIARATWVKAFLAGEIRTASDKFMEWRKPASIIERRAKERGLFFDGIWTGDGKATVYEVSKPSYAPKWSSARKVDVTAELRAALAV